MALPGKKILLRGNHDMFWDAKKTEKLNEMFKGKLERLRCSFEAAKAVGYEKFIMFLHYPPTSIGEMESPFTLMAQEYGAEKVIYLHCHGEKVLEFYRFFPYLVEINVLKLYNIFKIYLPGRLSVWMNLLSYLTQPMN